METCSVPPFKPWRRSASLRLHYASSPGRATPVQEWARLEKLRPRPLPSPTSALDVLPPLLAFPRMTLWHGQSASKGHLRQLTRDPHVFGPGSASNLSNSTCLGSKRCSPAAVRSINAVLVRPPLSGAQGRYSKHSPAAKFPNRLRTTHDYQFPASSGWKRSSLATHFAYTVVCVSSNGAGLRARQPSVSIVRLYCRRLSAQVARLRNSNGRTLAYRPRNSAKQAKGTLIRFSIPQPRLSTLLRR